MLNIQFTANKIELTNSDQNCECNCYIVQTAAHRLHLSDIYREGWYQPSMINIVGIIWK